MSRADSVSLGKFFKGKNGSIRKVVGFDGLTVLYADADWNGSCRLQSFVNWMDKEIERPPEADQIEERYRSYKDEEAAMFSAFLARFPNAFRSRPPDPDQDEEPMNGGFTP